MTDYSFAGIGHAEANDRHDEHPTGVPPLGAGADLITAPLASRHFWTGVRVQNIGATGVLARMKHGGASKSVAAEILTALMASTTVCRGKLQFGSITPGTVVVTEDGDDYTDPDEDGIIYDAGLVARGTINYDTGAIDITFPAAVNDPVLVAYDHTDSVDFQSAAQTTVKATGGVTPSTVAPFTVQLGFGRVVPGLVTIADGGALTFADDGKGNIVETTAAAEDNVGTIDYGTGLITFTDASAALTGNMTVTYRYNPFAALLAAAGGCKLLDMLGGSIPELTSEVFADGIKGETSLVLWGESTSAAGGALKTQWSHFGDDPIEVAYPYSEVAIGGETNNPPA